MGEGESEMEGERETRGGTEEGLPGPFSDAVTKTLGPESDPGLERRRGRGQPLEEEEGGERWAARWRGHVQGR